MGTIANLQYKSCAWEHDAEELLLNNKLFDSFSSHFSFNPDLTYHNRRVYVEGFVSKHFNCLEKKIELVVNSKIISYNISDYLLSVFNGFLLSLSSLAVLLSHLSLYIYNLLSFITNYFLEFLVFKGFYYFFFVKYYCVFSKHRSTIHEFTHENTIGGV